MKPRSLRLPQARKALPPLPGAKSGLTIALVGGLLGACGGNSDTVSEAVVIPQLAAAQAGSLANCTSLSGFSFAGTTITAAVLAAADSVVSNADGVSLSLPEHCIVQGKMNQRTGIDGKPYAIGFELRLPVPEPLGSDLLRVPHAQRLAPAGLRTGQGEGRLRLRPGRGKEGLGLPRVSGL